MVIFLRSILSMIRAKSGVVNPHEHYPNEIYSVFVSVVDDVIIQLVLLLLFDFLLSTTQRKNVIILKTHTTHGT